MDIVKRDIESFDRGQYETQVPHRCGDRFQCGIARSQTEDAFLVLMAIWQGRSSEALRCAVVVIVRVREEPTLALIFIRQCGHLEGCPIAAAQRQHLEGTVRKGG